MSLFHQHRLTRREVVEEVKDECSATTANG